MKQLSGVDASFLHLEDSRVTGHVGGLIVLDPSDLDHPLNVETIKEHVGARIGVLPPLRWALVEVPFGIDRPYWQDLGEVDLDFHIRGLALPAPGTKQQLIDQISRLHARPLDRAHPLWELYVIEGLEGGRVGIYTKLHHAAIDGKAGMEITTTLLSTARDAAPPKGGSPPPAPATRPTDREMFARGLMGLLGQPQRGVELWLKTMNETQRQLRTLGVPALEDLRTAASQATTTAPRLSFNASLTARRTWAYGSVSLETVKAIKNANDCTINDVVMALCAGALRRWLIDHDELPDRPLRVMVPVSIRKAGVDTNAGNQVSSVFADLPTHLEDPVERLAAVHTNMSQAKEMHDAVPATLLQDFAQFAAPAAAELVARTAAQLKVANHAPIPFNLVISNVPGPREPLYYAGALMEANYPVSMISDGMGLNITFHSYRDNLDFGLLSCPELISDLDTIMCYLSEELDLLAAHCTNATDRN